MVHIAEVVSSLGGIAQKQQLVARGARDIDLTRAVRQGDLIRARQGWYATMPADSLAVRAVRVGGRLTGMSAVDAAGGWVLGNNPLHVSVPENGARLRQQFNRFARLDVANTRGVVIHWDAADLGERGTVAIVGMVDALHRVIRDEPLERAVAGLDWALHANVIDGFDLELLKLSVPAAARHVIDWTDSQCESLPESLARTRLRLAGHHVVSQVPLATGEKIDLVVDGCVALEVDGDEFHRDRFERDRAKDLECTIAGFHTLRPSARAVFGQWDRVALAIDLALYSRGVVTGGHVATHFAGGVSEIQDCFRERNGMAASLRWRR
jgi:very-short-patch-repair endonuclease